MKNRSLALACDGAETITGVALLAPDGRVIALPRPYRHHHLFAFIAFCGQSMDSDDDACTQGFTTSSGRFVGREEAFEIVHAAGQPNRRSGNPGSKELFSEDVW